MARILLTAGPTRAYIDAVRYLTNASSGRMAASLARAALSRGHEVTIVSGPVGVRYPGRATVIPVLTTAEMLAAALAQLPTADGVIAAAAPCDFSPGRAVAGKIPRGDGPLTLRLRPSQDVIATLASRARRSAGGSARPWFVAFALEPAADPRRACDKIDAKRCDLIVVNDLSALESTSTGVAVYDARHVRVGERRGTKRAVAGWLIRLIERQLIDRPPAG